MKPVKPLTLILKLLQASGLRLLHPKPALVRVPVRSATRFFVGTLLCVASLSAHEGFAQQHPLYTQYMFNGLVINPAYTGSHESITLTAALRRQWTGIKGAPQTQIFSMHSPIKFSRSAAGVVATHDMVGVTHQYMMYGTYAYRIPVSENARLSVGGQVGMTYYTAKLNDLEVVTQNGQVDPAFAATSSRVLPNLGIGVYYYSKRTYVGLSLPTLIDNKWNNQDPLVKATQQRHYFLTAGRVFDLSPSLKFKPNVLLKWVENGPFQYDLNANLLVQDVVWVGVSYRMQDSIDGLLQWNVNDQLSMGYSYGYPTSSLAALQSGTHEVVVTYRVKRTKNMVLSPRYF
ncbi:PorP/SprF family type IX secretion system membrane protein [Chryseolinea lacunae]|uniref:Type IX secretion system membrane protein PorP/SprF n=1 Tax=Chryseolinea lacunae TaxID=2801331 RepID=A0ABS1KLD6_9BACT|nr:type IX secretion system membrane protein PorP/SprF [Chryseolinea lacunae]MBL0740053.1 type IX secretion system membrane protein PorP/SprF [Chryseolinea lacunae]